MRLERGAGAVDDAHEVGLLHDHELLAIELDLGAGPFAEQHAVAGLDVERLDLAVLAAAPGPTATTSPSIGFSLAVSGMMIPPAVFSSGHPADQDTIMQWLETHRSALLAVENGCDTRKPADRAPTARRSR